MTRTPKADTLAHRRDDDENAERSWSRWTADRVARLGFLVGQGFDAERVARDPIIASTTRNVHRQVLRFGLAFRDAPSWRLPAQVGRRLDAAGRKRGLSRDGLVRALMLAAGSDDGLIDNILDDGI